MTSAVSQPDAIALDFDGVLCNGLKEYFQTALKAYCQIWPDQVPPNGADWEAPFGQLRPVVETGWEMPIVLRALHQGWSEVEMLLDWPKIRNQVMTQSPWEGKQVGALVDQLRDQWIQSDLGSWLALHEFYPGVAAQLSQWIDSHFPIFIITTKESRFVQALLQQAGIFLPAAVIFGKDSQQSKAQTLSQLQLQGFRQLWFVEDRLATLQTIQSQADLRPVRLFLADWGYNTDCDRHAALTDASIHLLSLHQFSQPFECWLG